MTQPAASPADLKRWTRGWQAAVDAARTRGPRDDTASGVARVVVGAGASSDELAAIEAATAMAIPPSLQQLFGLARSVESWWHLADAVEPPTPFEEIFSGGFEWSVDHAVAEIEDYRSWVTHVFPDLDDPYDAVWHAKYPWLSVPNGDRIALDVDERVVYLSHDDGVGHGYLLGRDVVDFLDRWTVLGCPGPEDWQWLPFVATDGDGLDPDGAHGRAWRAWFGIP